MTQAEFAREIGVSDERVRQYRIEGYIEMGDDGKIDVAKAKRALAARGDATKSNTRYRLYKNHEGVRPDTEIGPDDDLNTQHLKAKIEYQYERARLARIQADEAEELVIARDTVQRDTFAIFRAARHMMLAIPDRVSAQLSGLHDKRDIHRVLTEELTRAAAEFADRAEAGDFDEQLDEDSSADDE